MSRNIGPTVEILLRRVRQEGGMAVNPDFATEIYSRCEQVVNTALKRIIVKDQTLSTPKEKLVYNFRDEFPSAIEIVSISESDRELFKCRRFYDFSGHELNWFRNITGTRFEAWMQLGRDLLILYPGQVSASSVSVSYVKLLTFRDDFEAYYNTASELHDEDVDMALGLAELILLLRYRQVAHIPSRLKSLMGLLRYRGLIL